MRRPPFIRPSPAATWRSRSSARAAAWAMRHLHPVTAANMVNFPLSHSLHSNRLFWRVDEDTLIGRFYLMHMIAIRPETRDFVIGASCDYSFIPEIVPVGQCRGADRFRRLSGGRAAAAPARARLPACRAARHPEARREPVGMDHRAPPRECRPHRGVSRRRAAAGAAAIAAEADRFIAEVGSALSAQPQPHRDHPYWLGAIAAHRWRFRAHREATQLPAPDTDEYFTDGPIGYSLAALIAAAAHPRVRTPAGRAVWHPRWPDYRSIVAALPGLLREATRRWR